MENNDIDRYIVCMCFRNDRPFALICVLFIVSKVQGTFSRIHVSLKKCTELIQFGRGMTMSDIVREFLGI